MNGSEAAGDLVLKCWFLRREENRNTREKNPRRRGENQQQTQPKSENRTRATLVGGECSHHYAIPAPTSLIFHTLPHYLLNKFNVRMVLQQYKRTPASAQRVERT